MEEERPAKRFRYESYNRQLGHLKVDTGKSKGLNWDDVEETAKEDDLAQTVTPLSTALEDLSLLYLTIPYQAFTKKIIPLTRSLPLILHYIPQLQLQFHEFFVQITNQSTTQNSGLDGVLLLYEKFFETVLDEGVGCANEAIEDLFRIGAINGLEALLIEKTYSTASQVFKLLSAGLLTVETKPGKGSSTKIQKKKKKSTLPAVEPVSMAARLDGIWRICKPYLSKEMKPHVRSCAAKVWAVLLRRARGFPMRCLVTAMVKDLDNEDAVEGLAAALSEGLKGAPHLLHSRAPQIYTHLVLHLLQIEQSSQLLRVMILLTTSLIHHGSATAMQPVHELVIKLLNTPIADSPMEDVSSEDTLLPTTSTNKQMELTLRLAATLVGVRKGQRLPTTINDKVTALQSYMMALQGLTQHLSSSAEGLKREYLKTLTATLVAGKVKDWLSPGISLIKATWGSLDLREKLAWVRVLVRVGWKGVEQFILADVARISAEAMEMYRLETLGLLALLADHGYLDGGLANVEGGQWKIRLGKLAANCLTMWNDRIDSLDQSDIRAACKLFKVCTKLDRSSDAFLPSLTALLIKMRERLCQLSEAEAKAEYAATPYNRGYMLSCGLRAMNDLIESDVAGSAEAVREIVGDVKVLMEGWSWCRGVMAGVGRVAEAAMPKRSPLETIVSSIAGRLQSEDPEIRTGALRILVTGKFPALRQLDGEMANPDDNNVFRYGLQVEDAGMSLQNVRERTTKIRKIGLVLRGLDIPDNEHAWLIEAIMRYLFSQLKVNFRPLYSDTIEVLSELGKRYPEMLWTIAMTEINKCHAGDLANLVSVVKPTWAKTSLQDESSLSNDEGKSFSCPNANKLYQATDQELASEIEEVLDTEIIEDQVNDARLDIVNYEAQILDLLGKLPSLTEKHGREIIPLFLNITNIGEEDEDDGDVNPSESAVPNGLILSRRLRQQRLSNYLTLFSRFGNPKALYRTDDILAAYLDILSKGENPLQNLALTCLLTYKHAHILPYEDNLRGLLTESKFRDELVKFPLGRDSEAINPDHRAELLPVVTRVLFGIMISKKGRHSSNQGPAARKNAILASLGTCSGDDFATLVHLMLRPFPGSLRNITVEDDAGLDDSVSLNAIRGRTQIGFLSMLGDVLKHLNTQMIDFWPDLLSACLALTAHAQEHISQEGDDDRDQQDESAEELDEEAIDTPGLPVRTIRNIGLKRLAAFFRAPAEFQFEAYMPYLFKHIISPRLALLPQENTQAPSAIMDIFSSWSQKPDMYGFLVEYDARVLSQLFACIGQPKVKPAVISHVLDVVDRLLGAAEDDAPQGAIADKFLKPYMSGLLDSLLSCMANISKVNLSRDDVTRRQIAVLPRISPFTESGEQARKLVTLLVPILRKPSKQVNEKVKADILASIVAVLRKVPEFRDPESDFYRTHFNIVSALFRSLHSRPARQNLVSVLQAFVEADPTLVVVTDIVSGLNAFSTKRLEEPDFDRRLQAFQTLHEVDHLKLGNRHWQPLLHNALFYLQDPEELTIRSNAGEAIKHFVDTFGAANDNSTTESMIMNLVLPGLKDVLRSRHELVRAEAVLVIGHMVEHCHELEVFSELRPLLADGDVEASFFSNVYHLQTHRRTRAFRRLVEHVSTGTIRDATVAGVFMPILGHVLTGATDKTDHTLINEAITTIGKLARNLGWSKYHACVLNYIRIGTVKGPLQKYYVRAITSLLDNFHFDMQQRTTDTAVEQVDAEEDQPTLEVDHAKRESAKIADYVTGKLLPTLVKFVELKDETEDSVRIPIALGIVKVAMALPVDIRDEEIGRVITVLSQILRSKDQDTRDLVRETISKIALTLGPDWLSRIIKELRSSLQRGPQLHVLAVVTHAILTFVTTESAGLFSNLDESIPDVVAISAEVIWGQSGQDVVAEGFKTKMREVRGASSRGYDSFQLVSRLVSPQRVNQILVPLKNIMRETPAVKPMQQLDEALHRIASGLNSNPLLGPIEMLRLCHTLISSSAEFLRPSKAGKDQEAPAKDAFRVHMKRKLVTDEDHYKENSQKFVGFGLDLFVTAFRRGKFDFADAEILARLAPLVNAIGNALFSKSDFVLGLALKASAAITKTPIKAVDDAVPAMVVQIIAVIRRCGGSASSEVAQTAIRSLAVIIRDCKAAVVKEKQLAYLVEIIGPDLDEHETQAPAFALLRAILSKRFVVPEIYDLMEKVASVMVTSQSVAVQELCRSAMLQFLLDYPQGKGRLKSTMQFLASNLSYVFESGRISVMELLSHCFAKFSDELVSTYSDMFFLALVIVIANDDSEKCRSMAGVLLKKLIERYEAKQMAQLTEKISKWAAQRDQDAALARSSAVISALAVQSGNVQIIPHLQTIVGTLNATLLSAATLLHEAEVLEPTSAFDVVELDYALPYQTLNTLSIILDHHADLVDGVAWKSVVPLLIFPHDWVRLAAAKLLVFRFGRDIEASDPDENHEVARKCCLILASGADSGLGRRVPNEKLCGQLVRLLFTIGKTWINEFDAKLEGGNTLDPDSEDEDDGNEDNDGDKTNNHDGETRRQNGLSWLMSRLSFVARRLIINKPSTAELITNPIKWTPPLTAVFQTFAALIDTMSAARVKTYLKHVCEPMYRILDESGGLITRPGDVELDNLNMLVTEIRDLVSQKVGVSAFSRTWEDIRARTAEKRSKRRMTADERMVREPELEAARRHKRAGMKIDHKKRKTRAFADAKSRERPTKRRN